MDIFVPTATRQGERRVGVTPDSAGRLIEAGHHVTIEPGAGAAAGFEDEAYQRSGAIVGDQQGRTDLIVVVHPPPAAVAATSAAVLGLLEPLDDPASIADLAATGCSLLAFELVPRTTRAQAVDALSSQATIAGYEAVLDAAALTDRIFPMLTTAAGTLRPSVVLVLGAGVAGLQAIATARRLGAVVSGFDVRAAAAEQVESLGARFVTLDLPAQDERAAGGYAAELASEDESALLDGLQAHVSAADIVITTAAIPGRPAPRLVTKEMVETMRPGAVIIDGAASTGGNCDLTVPGRTIDHRGVIVSGPLDLASRAPNHASQLYARNVAAFIALITGDEASLCIDVEDDIVSGALVAAEGRVVHERLLATADGREG